MSTRLPELRGKLDDVRAKAAKVFEEAGDDLDMAKVTSIDGDSAAKAAQLKAWNDEMADLGKEIDELESLGDMKGRVDRLGEVQDHPGHQSEVKERREDEQRARKSLGELFVDSAALKGWTPGMRMGPEAELKVDLKNLFETSTGWLPWDDRRDLFVEALRQPLWIMDLVSQARTTSDVITYLQQTAVVNSAAAVAEGAEKPEASLAVERVEENVRKIAVVLPVTDEQLSDVPQARTFIDSQLGFMVREELEQQILSGDGTAPNISGILDRSIQSQALGGDTKPDSVYKAIVKVRTTGRDEPDAVAFHPNDWTDVRLLKTSDGIYIWGAPMDAGPERIWGIRVVQTTGMTENTALVGNFRRAILFMREGLTMKVGYVDDQFIKNTQTIIAELRAALAVIRLNSFCKVTGL